MLRAIEETKKANATQQADAQRARNDFLQGFALAVAALARDHDEPTHAKNLMEGFGVTIDDLREAGVEAFNLIPIKHAMR